VPVRYFNSKFNKIAMMNLLNYIQFLKIPELYRFSFLDFCEYTSNDSKKHSSKPLVCIIAFKDHQDFPKMYDLFRSKINEIEGTVFERFNNNEQDLNDYVHKIQFGTISLKSNPNFNKEIVQKSKVKNPRYMVYIHG
jgi:hypothetical protein